MKSGGSWIVAIRNLSHLLGANKSFLGRSRTPKRPFIAFFGQGPHGEEDRKQTVKIADHPWADDNDPVIRVQSRVCAITDPQTVLILLQANAHAELGGFVMDTSSEPNAVDVVYSVLRDALDFPALAVVVQHVANLADKYEHQLTGCDEF